MPDHCDLIHLLGKNEESVLEKGVISTPSGGAGGNLLRGDKRTYIGPPYAVVFILIYPEV